jgi:hypothetical protein
LHRRFYAERRQRCQCKHACTPPPFRRTFLHGRGRLPRGRHCKLRPQVVANLVRNRNSPARGGGVKSP